MWWARCGRATGAADACGRGAVWATTTAAARGTGARCGRGRNGAGDGERWRWWCDDGGRVSRRGEGAMGDGRTVPVVAAVVAAFAAVVVVSSCGRSEPKKNECTGDGGVELGPPLSARLPRACRLRVLSSATAPSRVVTQDNFGRTAFFVAISEAGSKPSEGGVADGYFEIGACGQVEASNGRLVAGVVVFVCRASQRGVGGGATWPGGARTSAETERRRRMPEMMIGARHRRRAPGDRLSAACLVLSCFHLPADDASFHVPRPRLVCVCAAASAARSRSDGEWRTADPRPARSRVSLRQRYESRRARRARSCRTRRIAQPTTDPATQSLRYALFFSCA